MRTTKRHVTGTFCRALAIRTTIASTMRERPAHRNEYGKEMKRREEEKGGMRREEENEQREEVEARRFIEENGPARHHHLRAPRHPRPYCAHYFASANAYTTGFYQRQVTLPVLVPAPCAIDSLQSEDATHSPAASTPFLWALLYPVINRSHESIPAKTESTAISLHSSLKDFALSVSNPDPTSVSIFQETSTSGFCSTSSFSEKLKLSKDVILRPTSSLMSLEGSTNSLSVVPSMTSSKAHVAEAVPTLSSSALMSSTLGLSFLQDYLPKFVDTHAPAVLAAVGHGADLG
ncbi:hypothetical protein C8R48DRAFT_769551 [Suillus tomentosus]|nr:hypothetical protein C8R48DRAFT_769551 [Suillus tomentosus]